MAVSIDASSPAAVTATASAAATFTTASFTPPANTLLVAVASVGYSGSTQDTTFSISDSLSGSWSNDAIQFPASGGLPQNLIASRFNVSNTAMTVTLNTGTHTKGVDFSLFVLKGTATSSWLGGHAVSTTTMDGSVTTTTVGALVLVGAGYDTNATLTADGNTTTTNHLTDNSDGLELFTGHSTNTVSSPGATTYGWTGAGATAKTWAAAEYVPAATNLIRDFYFLNQAVRTAGSW